MHKLKLRQQLLILITAIILGFVFIGAFSYWGLNKLKVKGALYEQIVQGKDLVADILPPPEYLLETHLVVHQLRFANNSTDKEKLIEKIGSLKKDFESRHDYWQQQDLSPNLNKPFFSDSYESGKKYFEKIYSNYIPAARAGNIKLMDSLLPKLAAEYEIHRKGIDETVVIANADSDAREQEAARLSKKVTTVMMSAFATIIVVLLLITLAITRGLFKTLGGEPAYAMSVVKQIADGDLTVEVKTAANDDSSLLAAMKSMQDNLQGIVSGIKASVDEISTAAGEIASGNQDLSSRTEEQASSLEETASSMEQLASTVKQNAENAKQANQQAMESSTVAVKGGQAVSEVVTTMSSINESSRKIVDIISVIDGIAFQTNILALNAAVEAARAGEQGRGFAVVAGEVRNLAQRSAAAAKEIKALISDSVEKVEGGTKQVEAAGKTMEEIVASVKRVTDIMADISAASLEQSAGIDQVNKAITQMDEVTQQNAALVEQAAAAAESMEEQAHNLMDSVSVFKVAATAAPAKKKAGMGNLRTVSVEPEEPVKLPKGKKSAPKLTHNEEWEEF